jgi:hypothetical protein
VSKNRYAVIINRKIAGGPFTVVNLTTDKIVSVHSSQVAAYADKNARIFEEMEVRLLERLEEEYEARFA